MSLMFSLKIKGEDPDGVSRLLVEIARDMKEERIDTDGCGVDQHGNVYEWSIEESPHDEI